MKTEPGFEYLVWPENSLKEDAARILARSFARAVEFWARNEDIWTYDYAISKGDEVRVFVERIQPESERRVFVVSGGAEPVYHAQEVTS